MSEAALYGIGIATLLLMCVAGLACIIGMVNDYRKRW